MKLILQINCKYFEDFTKIAKVLSPLFIRIVNKTYCNEIGMVRLKSVLFFSFSSMISIQILGGGVVKNPFRGNQSKERLILLKNRLKW